MTWYHLFFLIFLIDTFVDAGKPKVVLRQGSVEGTFRKSYDGKNFSSFEGIPYAKPPVGSLRFMEPQPAESWNGTLIADQKYVCMQLFPFPIYWGPRGTEDCLYLYVYVPREKIDPDDNMNVVVHIHGGAFMIGSPSSMAEADYIIDQNVIYVTMNYRLGIFGFLSTEDGVVPGNNGLKDQNLALKWIRENIKSFGGNPDSVTITGLSAGGASVHYHYLSPVSRGLFARGISQSGTALLPWALTEKPLEKMHVVAKNVSCERDSTKEMVECLQTVDKEKLILSIINLFVLIDSLPPTPFGPVIEKGGAHPFLSQHPYQILKNGDVYDVPWVVGFVKEEGIFPVGPLAYLRQLDAVKEQWNSLMPGLLDILDTVDEASKSKVVEQVKEFYFKKESPSLNTSNSLIRLFSDRYFLVDGELSLRLHAKAVKSPVYLYWYHYEVKDNLNFPPLKSGVAHGTDGKLMFKWLINRSKLNPNDEKVMKKLTEFVAKYAATGKPQYGNLEFKPVDPSIADLNYFRIDNDSKYSRATINHLGNVDFWNSLPIQENEKLF